MPFFQQSSPPTNNTNTTPINGRTYRTFEETEAAILSGSLTSPNKTPAQLLEDARTTFGNLTSNATGIVNKQLSSIVSTFDKNAKKLAGAVSKELGGLFKDTNVTTASTPTRQTSDPVSTLLKSPLASGFKLDSINPGSVSTGGSGNIGEKGSLSDLMIGTQFSTVLERFSLDTKEALGSVLTTTSYENKIKGLFGDFSVTVNESQRTQNTLDDFINDPKNAVFGIPNIKVNVTEALKDIQGVESVAGNFGISGFGTIDAFSFYTQNVTSEVVNDKGEVVVTAKPISGDTASSTLSLLKKAGCSLTNADYGSLFGTKSLFNLGMLAATANGMLQELKDMVNCTQADTTWGQDALRRAFTSSMGDSTDVSSILIKGIKDTTPLEVDRLDQTLFTSSNLLPSDADTVNDILSDLKSSPTKVLEITDLGTSEYPVWDAAILEQTQPAFMTTILQSPSMDTFVNGSLLTVDSTGRFV